MEGNFSGEQSLQVDFDKYMVLHQLFIKHQLFIGNLKRF